LTDSTPMRRRNFHVPDDLWDRAGEAAARLADETGLTVTRSDLIRRGLEREVQEIENGLLNETSLVTAASHGDERGR